MPKPGGLRVSKDLLLPIETVTGTQAILARKRSGKSYTASVEAEEMLELGQQVQVLDPTGAWWGLRSSADGKSAGYSIVVFGGRHQDGPLDWRSGRQMAAAAVSHRFSAIYDISEFRLHEQLQFVMDFAGEMLRQNTKPVHIFLDEADTFAPQRSKSKLQEQCLGEVTRLVKQGGIKGLGITMITQRSASISWDVLSQVDLLTVLRMGAPHDVNPVVQWLQSETDKEFAKEVQAALPSLPVGTAFFASAAMKLAKRVQVRERRTFNSGATPKPGERVAQPKVMADVDVKKLGEQIAASLEQTRANSPEELKKRIRELEAAALKVQPAKDNSEEVRMLKAKLEELSAEAAAADERLARCEEIILKAQELANYLADVLVNGTGAGKPVGLMAPRKVPAKVTPATAPPAGKIYSNVHQGGTTVEQRDALKDVSRKMGDLGITPAQQKVLNAIAWIEEQNFEPTLAFVAFLAGYTPTSGNFQNLRGALRTAGLVEYHAGSVTRLTPAGKALATHSGGKLSVEDLHAAVLRKLTNAQQKVLQPLLDVWPDALALEQLGEAAGYSPTSGNFQNLRGSLRSLGLVNYVGSGQTAAADVLFQGRS